MSKKRVVVVGAGPAGASTAMKLAQYPQIETILLDRATFPRTKACGSGLSPWCLELLEEIGMTEKVLPEAFPVKAARVGGMRGKPIMLRTHYEAAVLLRERFDTIMAYEAASRGASLREGIKVEDVLRQDGRVVGVKTSDGEIEADAVVLCNGAKNHIAKVDRPGRTLHTIMGWYEGVKDTIDGVEIYFDEVVKPYYGWVFPESERRVNIGICFDPATSDLNARQRFDVFLAERMGKRMDGSEQIGRLIGHPIEVTHRPTALAQDGLLFAGEAGRLVDPATAEGIHHAIASGLIAGDMLGKLFAEGRSPSAKVLEQYTQSVRKRIGGRLLAGEAFWYFARTPMMDFALQFGSLRPVQAMMAWALSGA
ncbi:MAG: NAD(P)/FAD-dependent oxidoreductase [Myxococcales bacterium]|nr:NAD(P)/FAD-dependent oxidoreductase [Myxococcales bacterium]